MLHKKFKPSKCKTALNLAKSRIKLLKNKKDVQVKQLRREVAQLLEAGQNQTARIRVEHVVREEKMMGAFELIEIYCELIVARLPIIETQKNCPIDLKEAIASIIFAAPRCGDIPELEEVRKHFSAKYGKEFVTSATELRPHCGVSRNLVEKLSAKAPDGPTKVKILTAIAEENNIKWEPNWFEDEKPAPSVEMPKEQHMEKPVRIQMEPLNFEIADNLQHSHAYDDLRSKASSQSHPHANIDVNVGQTSTANPDRRPSGSYSDGKAFNHSSGVSENSVEARGQNWTMEFKDAATAAQAAAESAELASMAARAAAELSRQNNNVKESSSRPLGSYGHDRSEHKKVYASRVSKDKHMDEDPANTSFNQRSERIHVDRGAYEQGNLTKDTLARTVDEEFGVHYESKVESKSSFPQGYQDRQSRGSVPSPGVAESEYDVFESPDRESHHNEHVNKPYLEETVKTKIQRDSIESQSNSFGDEYSIFSDLNDRKKDYPDDGYYHRSKQVTVDYDDWHVNTAYSGFSDAKVDPIFSNAGGEDRISGSDDLQYGFSSAEDVFVSTEHKTNEMDDTNETETHTDTHAVFDDYGSDNEAEMSYDLSSPGKSSAKRVPFHPGRQSFFSSHLHHGPDVSESFRESPLYSKLNEPLPIKFDSDGESSGSERALKNEKADRAIQSSDDGKKDSTLDVSAEHLDNPSIYSDVPTKRRLDAGNSYKAEASYERTSSREELHALEPHSAYYVFHEGEPSQSSDPVPELKNEMQAGPENVMGLNFGILPGGRRNRRQWDPPYKRGEVGDASSSPRSPTPFTDNALKYQVSSGEVESRQSSEKTSNTEGKYSPSIRETVHRTWEDPTGFFNSHESSSEDDDAPKQPAKSRTQGAGISRRTKGSSARSVGKQNIPDSSFYATEYSSSKLQTETAISRQRPERKVSEDVYSSSSAVKQTCPNDTEISRTSNSKEDGPSRENSTKKPGHVHPKLPDFETLTARMQALRSNRQQ